jgi:hypothetical protein
MATARPAYPCDIAFHRGYKRSMERTGDGLPLGLFFELGDMNTRASLYLL